MDCVVHYPGTINETLVQLTSKRIETIKSCAEGWIKTGKEPERTIAEGLMSAELNTTSMFHPKCYAKFANTGKVSRALTGNKQHTLSLTTQPGPSQQTEVST